MVCCSFRVSHDGSLLKTRFSFLFRRHFINWDPQSLLSVSPILTMEVSIYIFSLYVVVW
jgi:hypothetical protein